MKLSEKELQELAKQLGNPDGENGIKIGEMMNFTNGNMISETIKKLEIESGDTVLEIGPGNGNHVNQLLSISTDIHYTGIDISETMVSEATKAFSEKENVAFRLTDGITLDFPDASFSKIYTTNTIYFWTDPQQYASETARVLKAGGTLCIGFIPESTMQKIPFAKYGFTLYTIDKVTALIETAGLVVTEAITDTEMVMSNTGSKIEREFVILTAKKPEL